jgi:hypothetical protein
VRLYAYCLRHAGEPPPAGTLRGIGGAAVSLFEHGGLGVWFSWLDSPRADETSLREHDRVVRSALRSATPLPLRFGASFTGTVGLRGLLDERRQEFLASLARVAGRVEMGLTVFWDEQRARAQLLAERPELHTLEVPPSSGREYLEQKVRATAVDAALRSRAGDVMARVESLLRDTADIPIVRTPGPRPGVAGTLAQLVRRDMVAEYRSRVAAADEILPDLRLALSGPWGPYSFV